MMNTKDRSIEMIMEDAIMELPIRFELEGVHYFLYPVTLGTAYLISRERESMAQNAVEAYFNGTEDDRKKYRMAFCRIVALQTLGEKAKILDKEAFSERTNIFYQSLDNDDLFSLYDAIIKSMEDAQTFIKNSGLDLDKKKLRKIAKYKEDGGHFSFGARTPYGSVIAPACEKFGWTMDYVVWGISYTNLQMLLADAEVSLYLSKEDRKKLRISADREIIDANDPANKERIRAILNGE